MYYDVYCHYITEYCITESFRYYYCHLTILIYSYTKYSILLLITVYMVIVILIHGSDVLLSTYYYDDY